MVAVLNDSPSPWQGELMINKRPQAITVNARSVAYIEISDKSFVVAELDGARALWFGDDTEITDPGLTIEAIAVPGGLDVHVHATRLARDVLLQPDRIHPDAVVNLGFVTLLAGESAVFQVRAPIALDPSSVKAPWVLTDLSSVQASNFQPVIGPEGAGPLSGAGN